jgi:hypothetical protein
VTAGIGSRLAYPFTPGSASFSYTPTVTDVYEVSVTWPLLTDTPQYAHHIVTHAGGSTDVYLDQNNNTNPGASTRWNSMGRRTLNAGTQYTVTVTTTGSSRGTGGINLRADAVKWEFAPLSPPQITGQPTNMTLCQGAGDAFSVTASGTAPLSYRWRKNGSPLSDLGNIYGATTATLTINHVAAGHAGSYDVVITNTGGSVTSEAATLTVMTPVQPDFDADCDVDAFDLEIFEACTTGPAIPYDPDNPPGECTLLLDDQGIIPADFDGDGDVDQTDFASFQRCYSGEGNHADLDCVG